jgi:hypothetical protein
MTRQIAAFYLLLIISISVIWYFADEIDGNPPQVSTK